MAKHVADEGLITKIKECQTFAELASLKTRYVVAGFEKSVVFEKKLELIGRLLERRREMNNLSSLQLYGPLGIGTKTTV